MHYVYILKLDNAEYYTGQTADLEGRFAKHKSGDVPSTARYTSIEIAWYAGFTDKGTALVFEKYLKSGAGRAFGNKHLI